MRYAKAYINQFLALPNASSEISMLDNYEVVTPFNTLWSYNVAHNCDHATFNVDCCYVILQHLLRISTSTKAPILKYRFPQAGTEDCHFCVVFVAR